MRERVALAQDRADFQDSHSPAQTPAPLPAARLGSSRGSKRVMAFYEKVTKVKADVAAYLISCFPSA